MKLLDPRRRPDKDGRFGYCDTEQLFRDNLKRMPPDWKWRTNEILYKVNSQGYRAPEWEDVDWNNSVLFFGCSYVFGIGINFEDTVTEQLSKMINMPVVNLGNSGSSPFYHMINTIILKEQNIKPKAVVYYWPYSTRLAELRSDKYVVNHPSTYFRGAFNDRWVLNAENCTEYLRYLRMNVRMLWDCPVVDYHMEKLVCNRIPGLTYMKYSDPKTFLDDARDYNKRHGTWHAGEKTNKFWAQIVYDGLMKTEFAGITQR